LFNDNIVLGSGGDYNYNTIRLRFVSLANAVENDRILKSPHFSIIEIKLSIAQRVKR